jgi:hypothetical protein
MHRSPEQKQKAIEATCKKKFPKDSKILPAGSRVDQTECRRERTEGDKNIKLILQMFAPPSMIF